MSPISPTKYLSPGPLLLLEGGKEKPSQTVSDEIHSRRCCPQTPAYVPPSVRIPQTLAGACPPPRAWFHAREESLQFKALSGMAGAGALGGREVWEEKPESALRKLNLPPGRLVFPQLEARTLGALLLGAGRDSPSFCVLSAGRRRRWRPRPFPSRARPLQLPCLALSGRGDRWAELPASGIPNPCFRQSPAARESGSGLEELKRSSLSLRHATSCGNFSAPKRARTPRFGNPNPHSGLHLAGAEEPYPPRSELRCPLLDRPGGAA